MLYKINKDNSHYLYIVWVTVVLSRSLRQKCVGNGKKREHEDCREKGVLCVLELNKKLKLFFYFNII